MAVGDVLTRWDSRLDWAGEWPVDGGVLLQRFETVNEPSGTDRTMPDAADVDAIWTVRNFTAATAGLSAGRWGNNLSLNRSAPATEQTSLTVPYFAGLWPSSGKLLFRVWASLSFAMSFTPIISTRNTTGKAPLVYLSTLSDGRPRAMIYNSAGSAILDQSESIASIGWTPTANEWVCYLWLVDLDAKTSQVALVRRDTGQSFVGPVRTFTGTPNAACEANFEVGTLSPTASYWAGGYIDEVGYWQPTSADLASLVAEVVRALPARGTDAAGGAALTVSDTAVTATGAGTLLTGARPATWGYRPLVRTLPAALASQPAALLSTDNGATWSAPTTPASLPLTFTGLVRWQQPMFVDETLTALEVVEQDPPPVLDPISDEELLQNGSTDVTLTGTWQGTPTFTVFAAQGITTTVDGTTLTIEASWAAGEFPVTVTVTDSTGLTSDPATLTVTVVAIYDPPQAVAYAFEQIILLDSVGDPADVLPDAWDAKIFTEINGEQYITFTISATDPRASQVVNEARVRVAGQTYTIRQVTTIREGSTPTITAKAEAAFYDLARFPRLAAHDWADTQPGDELTLALAGTGWTIGAVTVSTRRTWTWEPGNPLEVCRQIQQVHGGDLVFDNTARTVSLLTTQGSDTGVFFTVGKNLKTVKRVLDTTQLVTRMHASTEDGDTFASINGGLDYVDDHEWIATVADGHLTFKSGTNPYTMLAITRASLGRYSKPRTTYEASVADLSYLAGHEIEAFSLGDEVTILDEQVGINITHKVVRLELDLLEPWNTVVTLSSTLRELGSSDTAQNSAVLTTGTDIDTRDLVPFNLLLNARFDNGLAHWAGSGVTVVDGGVTGIKHVEFTGGGVRWVEQTVAPDTRDVYTVSFQLGTEGFPEGVSPVVEIIAEITYDDATTETITQSVT